MKKFTLGLLLMFCISFTGHAQFNLGNKIKEKIAPKEAPPKQPEIEQKSDGSTTIKTDDGTLTIEESTSADAIPNSFLGSFRMNIKTTDTKGKTITSSILYHFSQWKTAMDPQMENSGDAIRIIFDLLNRKTIILTTDKKGRKTGIIMKMQKFTYTSDKLDQKMEQVIDGTTYKRTGEKKTIEGYLCEKWIITNEDGVIESWVTDQVDFNLGNAFGFLTASSGMPGSNTPQYKSFQSIKGFSLETTYTSKKGEKSIITVTDIQKGDVGESPDRKSVV